MIEQRSAPEVESRPGEEGEAPAVEFVTAWQIAEPAPAPVPERDDDESTAPDPTAARLMDLLGW